MNIDDIQQDLANLRAQLELNLSTNAGVIEMYETRQRLVHEFVSGKLSARHTDI